MFGAPPISEPMEECDLLFCTDEVRAMLLHACIMYKSSCWLMAENFHHTNEAGNPTGLPQVQEDSLSYMLASLSV